MSISPFLSKDLSALEIEPCIEELPELIDHLDHFESYDRSFSQATAHSFLTFLEALFINFSLNLEIKKLASLKKYFPSVFAQFQEKLCSEVALDYFKTIPNQALPTFYLMTYFYQLKLQKFKEDKKSIFSSLTLPIPLYLEMLADYSWLKETQRYLATDYSKLKNKSIGFNFYNGLIAQFEQLFPKEERFAVLLKDLEEILAERVIINQEFQQVKRTLKYQYLTDYSFDLFIKNTLNFAKIYQRGFILEEEKEKLQEIILILDMHIFNYNGKSTNKVLPSLFYLFPNFMKYYQEYFKKLLEKYMPKEEVEVLENLLRLYHLADFRVRESWDNYESIEKHKIWRKNYGVGEEKKKRLLNPHYKEKVLTFEDLLEDGRFDNLEGFRSLREKVRRFYEEKKREMEEKIAELERRKRDEFKRWKEEEYEKWERMEGKIEEKKEDVKGDEVKEKIIEKDVEEEKEGKKEIFVNSKPKKVKQKQFNQMAAKKEVKKEVIDQSNISLDSSINQPLTTASSIKLPSQEKKILFTFK